MWVPFDDIAGGVATLVMLEPRDTAAAARAASVTAASGATHEEGPSRPLDGPMDRYARGDDAAFDELYRQGAPKVRGFLLRLCGDAALADDLCQEAFLRVHRARGSFAPGAAALPWLLAIARNAFLDQTRRARARPRSVGGDDALAEREAPAGARADEELAAREAAAVVGRTLQALPVSQREAFVLIRFEGLRVSEAAEVLGTSEGAVKIRAFRAYEALREALARAEADPKPSAKGERAPR
jgi:RNA polymerase sigma-70 factor (ECF subfamily)